MTGMTTSFMSSDPLAESFPLRDDQFVAIGKLVRHVAGIHLHAGKEGLVRSRLAHRLRALGLADFDAYLSYLAKDASGTELSQMVDGITTNKTSFFRESEHFQFLQRTAVPAHAGSTDGMRIWSAGCSTGEEPYTIAMVLRELLSPSQAERTRILATDISARVLAKARRASYREDLLADVPPAMAARHFERDETPGTVRVKQPIRDMVKFARLNLMAPWPMRGPFDAIFCRNVMIYFERQTQQTLIDRFTELLAPGGHLFIGHSESLTALKHELHYVQPAVYAR